MNTIQISQYHLSRWDGTTVIAIPKTEYKAKHADKWLNTEGGLRSLLGKCNVLGYETSIYAKLNLVGRDVRFVSYLYPRITSVEEVGDFVAVTLIYEMNAGGRPNEHPLASLPAKPVCHGTGKRIYGERGAGQALVTALKHDAPNKPVRKYSCGHCGGWHLTSELLPPE